MGQIFHGPEINSYSLSYYGEQYQAKDQSLQFKQFYGRHYNLHDMTSSP